MAVFLSDTFTDTDFDDLVTQHTGETGATWSNHPDFGGTAIIYGNHLLGRDLSDAVVFLASGTPATANYTVTAPVRYDGVSGEIGVLGRCDGDKFYMAHITASTNAVSLYYYDGASFSQLDFAAFTPSSGTTYSLVLEMSGTTIRALIDGVEKCSVTDSSLSAAGLAGIYCNGFSNTSQGWGVASITGDTTAGGSTYTLTAAAGSFSLAGRPVALQYLAETSDASGQVTVTVTGVDEGSCTIIASVGAVTQSATITVGTGYALTASPATFTMSGVAAAVQATRLLTADAGSVTLSGVAATFPVTYRLTADVASATLSAPAVNLTRTGALQLAAEPAAFTLSGVASTLRSDLLVSAATSAYTVTTPDATLTIARTIQAEVSAFSLSGVTTELTRSARLIAATADAYLVFAPDAGSILTRVLTAEVASSTLTGNDVTLTQGVSGQYVLTAEPATYELLGVDPNLATAGGSGAGTIVQQRRRRGNGRKWW